jgi:5-methylcytosine-specific restriction protein A
MDGAGRITGDLTPECAAAVTAVLEALGKRRGPEDLRSAGQRFHDALQEGCELLLRAKLVPDRAGADTRVDVHIPLRDLLEMDGSSAVEDAWLRARAGEHGYLSGPDAEAVACDALIVPVVTGAPDWAVITQMITLIIDAYAHAAASPAKPAGPAGLAPPPPLPPQQWEDLQHALARLAIHFVSGPGAIASALRRALLDAPLNGKSVILDIGYSATIPETIRKAVALRDKGCAWPGCDRRPAHCDVHHVKHKKHGGKTSVTGCVLLCQYHHDICIHRNGWTIELLPDGSTRATSPDRQTILRSHPPPPATQPSR